MKMAYQYQKIIDIKKALKDKNIEYDNVIKSLLDAISNKENSKVVEDLISLKNSLLVDISMIKKQINNVTYSRKQYGHELKEWNLRKYID